MDGLTPRSIWGNTNLTRWVVFKKNAMKLEEGGEVEMRRSREAKNVLSLGSENRSWRRRLVNIVDLGEEQDRSGEAGQEWRSRTGCGEAGQEWRSS